jgi:hypothetical protein
LPAAHRVFLNYPCQKNYGRKIPARNNRYGRKTPFTDKRHVEVAAAGLLLRGESNISRHYRKTNRATKDASLGTAPAYLIRRKDGVFYPSAETFNNAYNIIGMNSLPSKTKETNKFKSGKRDNPNCDYCGQTETIEHLLHNCDEYSAE